jgi:hypothetical protein
MIFLELHHPIADQSATAFATSDFASSRKYHYGAVVWSPVRLGDEAIRSEEATKANDSSHVLLRVRNVTVWVTAATGDPSRRSAEQDRRAWRAATDLARSLAGLGH